MTVVLPIQAQSSPNWGFWSIMILLIGHMILVAMETIFRENMCYQYGYIIKLTGVGCIQSVQHCVIHHWKADTCSIPMVFEEV